MSLKSKNLQRLPGAKTRTYRSVRRMKKSFKSKTGFSGSIWEGIGSILYLYGRPLPPLKKTARLSPSIDRVKLAEDFSNVGIQISAAFDEVRAELESKEK